MPSLPPLLLLCALASQTPTSAGEEPQPIVLGRPAGWHLDAGRTSNEHFDLDRNTALREEARLGAAEIAVAPPGRYPVWERAPGWVRILVGDLVGWVRTSANESPGPGAVASAEDAPAPGASLRILFDDPSERLLRRATDILGGSAREGSLGPFHLLTDLDAPRLEAFLGTVAAHMPDTYTMAYGLSGTDPEGSTVILFSRRADYLATRQLLGIELDEDVAGFAMGSVAMLHGEGRSREEIARTLIHETAHLLGNAWLRPAPIAGDSLDDLEIPSWLAEGLAENLALSTVTRSGEIRVDRLARGVLRGAHTVHISGRSLQMIELVRAIERRRLPPLPELMGMERSRFLDPELRGLHYLHSATVVRFLLDDEALRPIFLGFLEDVSRHRTPATRLGDRLGDLAALDQRYRHWARDLVLREAL